MVTRRRGHRCPPMRSSPTRSTPVILSLTPGEEELRQFLSGLWRRLTGPQVRKWWGLPAEGSHVTALYKRRKQSMTNFIPSCGMTFNHIPGNHHRKGTIRSNFTPENWWGSTCTHLHQKAEILDKDKLLWQTNWCSEINVKRRRREKWQLAAELEEVVDIKLSSLVTKGQSSSWQLCTVLISRFIVCFAGYSLCLHSILMFTFQGN